MGLKTNHNCNVFAYSVKTWNDLFNFLDRGKIGFNSETNSGYQSEDQISSFDEKTIDERSHESVP
jgi:hypothetical protein